MKDPELITIGFPASSLYLRALAHHRLGQSAEARRWLNLAITRFVMRDPEYAYPWISTELEAAFGMRLAETSQSIKDAIPFLPKGQPFREQDRPGTRTGGLEPGQPSEPAGKRAPERAVALARLAVDHVPELILAWQQCGLGVQYRAGNWKASIAALEHSRRLERGGDCGQWIVLALAHGKLADDRSLTGPERCGTGPKPGSGTRVPRCKWTVGANRPRTTWAGPFSCFAGKPRSY